MGPRHDLPQNGLPGPGHLLGAAAWGERGCGDDVRGAADGGEGCAAGPEDRSTVLENFAYRLRFKLEAGAWTPEANPLTFDGGEPVT